MNCVQCGAPVTAGGVCAQCGTTAPQGSPLGGGPPVAPASTYGYPAPASNYGYASPDAAYPAFAAPQIPTPAGLSLPGAVKEVLSKYVTFQGRATRSEYWWWALALWLAIAVPWILAALASQAAGTSLEASPLAGLVGIYTLIVVLGSVLPSVAVAVRRMHDISQSGALFLINLVPTIGGLVFLVLCALPSKPFGNQYGLPAGPVDQGRQVGGAL